MKKRSNMWKYHFLLISSLCINFFELKSQPEIEFYNSGEVYRVAEQYGKAEQEYLNAIEENPNLFDAYIELAIIEYQVKENYDKAISYLDYCLKSTRDPEILMRVYLEKGSLYYNLGNNHKALKMFNKGISIKGSGETKALLYAYRGHEIYYVQDELNKSMDDFSKSITIYPTYEAYVGKGRLNYTLNNYEESERDFTQALNLSNNLNPLVLFYRGRTRNYFGKYELALEDLNKVDLEKLSIVPDYIPSYYYIRGKVNHFLKRYNEAILDLKKTLSFVDTEADAYYWLGRSYLLNAEYEKAINTYQDALEIEPIDEYSVKDIGICYYELGDIEKSEEYLRKAMEINNQNISIHFELGKVLIAKENYKEALKELNLAIGLSKEKDFNSEGAQEYYRSIAYFELHKVDEACLDIQKAMKLGYVVENIKMLKHKFCTALQHD